MFSNKVALLFYLWINNQTLADVDCSFKLNQADGLPEFYEFGPDLIAVVIYNLKTSQREELLTVGISFTEDQVKISLREIAAMISRKRLKFTMPVRRIKLDS